MIRLLTYLSLFFAIASHQNLFVPVKKYQVKGLAQGTSYQITYYSRDSLISKQAIDSILARIDTSMSLYNPYSLINKFNLSQTGVLLDHHMEKVIRKSLFTYSDTKGIFDITVAPLVKAWGFSSVKPNQLPDTASILQMVK